MARFAWVLLALIGPGLIAFASAAVALSPQTIGRSVLFLIAFARLVAGVSWAARVHEGAKLADLGFRNSGIWSFAKAIPLALFFILVFGPFADALLAWLGISSFAPTMDRFRDLPVWYMALTILIVAGGEEWLFRGYVIERLETLTGSTWLAGSISLIAFAVVHLPVWGPGPALTTLISGAILTVVYIATRDILALIIAHVATDFYGFILV